VADSDSGTRRQRLKLGISVVLILVAGGGIWHQIGGGSNKAVAAAGSRMYMCSDTGKTFSHTIREGEREPIECELCGKQTGYLAERCYWTKDATGEWAAKLEPTYVILKTRLDPDSTEKTYCPDCGREVKPHNASVNGPSQELIAAAKAAAGQE